MAARPALPQPRQRKQPLRYEFPSRPIAARAIYICVSAWVLVSILCGGLASRLAAQSPPPQQADRPDRAPAAQPPIAADATAKWDDANAEAVRLFALTVLPALQSKCFACHGQDAASIESGLDLTNRESAVRGGDAGYPILVSGRPEASWLYLAATWQHDELLMPPKENDRLSAEQLEALRRWIELGAPWPTDERIASIRRQLATGMTVATSGGLQPAWDARRYEADALWAYQPLNEDVQPPADPLLGSNPVDAFIDDRLVRIGLTPAPRADRRTLIRRLAIDMTGLPPTPEEVRAFVHDPAPEDVAWQRLVDRYLASPHYGEQWARHWLDVVRYADSAGFANDYERPNAWRYRDYVVRQFNLDRPLDAFIREQIAGDELDPDNPEARIAVGMLRMGPWEQTAMSVDRVTRQQFLDDVTDMIGQAFLAHPLQCARCHDHKFDPIPTRDYYRIQAVFATTQFAEPDVPWLPDENRQGFDAPRKYLRERIAFFQDVLRRLDEKQERAERSWYAQRNLPYAPRSQKLKEGVPESEIAPRHVGFTAEDLGIQRIANKYLHRHRWELDRYAPIALSVYSGPTPQRRSVQSRLLIPQDLAASGTVEHTAILAGGDPFSPTLPVTPGVLSVVTGILSPRDVAARSSITSQAAGRRAEFARWLTDPTRNPITPRVLVNRLWQHHFGRGIVATANNFGTAAARPTHPQLLEYLAVELVRSGWSAKHIHRLILTSDTYCRAHRYPDSDSLRERELAEKDPLATSWARRTIRRMEAEELHDSILAVSGLLNREIGGVPVCPDINLEVAAQPRQIMGTYAPVYQPSPLPADRNRRRLYALRLRGLPDPMLEVFNQPPPDRPCEMRDSSTVAPQALTLLNSPYSYNRAAAMARHLMREVAGPDPASDREPQEVDAAIIDRAFQWALGRPATDAERQECLAHWRAMTERHRRIELSDTIPSAEMTRMFVDENTGEQFAFTEPLERNRDYVPDLRLSQTDPRWRGLADVCLVLLSSNEFVYVP